jgi:UDP-glucose 4-epimerase
MKVLVTGGAGFIGHHLVAELIRLGDDVTVIDSLITGDKERLIGFEGHVTFVEGDIRERHKVQAATHGAEVVFHLAALPSVQRSVLDPRLTNEINVGGTLAVLEAAAEAGVRRVVLAGSSSVYGSSPELPRRESQVPDPRSPYAISKLAAEHYTMVLGELRGIETVVLRYFNVFGPGQDPDSMYAAVVPRFITSAIEGRSPTVNGDGRQSRDFTYIDNVVAANLLAATVPGAAGGTFNVGCGERYNLLDLLSAIEDAAGRKVDPVFGPPLPGDVRDSQADITLAQQVLGYQPLVGFREGIARTFQSYLDQAAHPVG